MDANTIIQIISSLGFPIVKHKEETIAEKYELTTLIKVLTDEKER